MNRTELTLLLDYHYWARDRLLDAVEALSPEQFTRVIASSFPSVRDTLVHMYSADWIWYRRWQGDSPGGLLSPGDFHDLASVRTAWAELEAGVRRHVDSLDQAGIDRATDYRLITGVHGSSLFWQMLQHVVNHSSYHRGQVVTMLRQIGAAAPKPLDLIAFYRERDATTAISAPR